MKIVVQDHTSKLMKLLSIFEQSDFVDKEYLKKFVNPIDPEEDKILKKIIDMLEMIAADPLTRRIMEEQDFAARNMEFWKNTNEALKDTIATIIAERDNAWTARDNALALLNEYQQRFGTLTPSPN